MDKALFEVILSQGIWTILSFFLIFYIIKNQERRDKIQEERENNYQKIISELSQKFELIHNDIQEIKKKF
ncbi:MAG: BhlA/UviB family holin-like peptide [Clostridium sp.]